VRLSPRGRQLEESATDLKKLGSRVEAKAGQIGGVWLLVGMFRGKDTGGRALSIG